MRFRPLARSLRALRFGARWRRRLLFASVLAIAFVATALAIAGLGSPPAAPSGLAISNVTFNGMDLSWTDNATDANTTAYQPRNLVQRTHYYWRVYAKNALGRSGPAWADATTLVGPPTAPSDLTAATVSSTQIDLTWTDRSGDEQAFEIQRREAPDGTFETIQNFPGDPNSGSTERYSDTAVQGLTAYEYRVRATSADPHADSTWAGPIQATSYIQPPTGLTATAGDSTVTLSWTASHGAESYTLYRSGDAPADAKTVTGITGTTYIDTTVSNGTIYTYSMTATSGEAESDQTDSVTTTPQIPTYPKSISVEDDCLIGGGTTTGTITLSRPATSSVSVALTSPTTDLSFPQSITISAGEQESTFPIVVSPSS